MNEWQQAHEDLLSVHHQSLQAFEVRLQRSVTRAIEKERAQFFKLLAKERDIFDNHWQPESEDTPNGAAVWVCDRIEEEVEHWMTPETALKLDVVPEAWLSAYPNFDYTEESARRALAAFYASVGVTAV